MFPSETETLSITFLFITVMLNILLNCNGAFRLQKFASEAQYATAQPPSCHRRWGHSFCFHMKQWGLRWLLLAVWKYLYWPCEGTANSTLLWLLLVFYMPFCSESYHFSPSIQFSLLLQRSLLLCHLDCCPCFHNFSVWWLPKET